MKTKKYLLKGGFIFLSAFLIFSANTYSQDDFYVDRLLDSAEYHKNNNWNYSLDFALKALKLAEKSGSIIQQADALNILGYIYYLNLQKYDSSFQYLYKAYELSEANNYKKGLSDYYVIKAIISQMSGNGAQTRIFLSKSLELARQLNDKKLLANSYCVIAVNLSYEGHLEEALTNINLAIAYYKEIKDINSIAGSYFVKSEIFFSDNKDDSAFVYLKKSKTIYEKLNDKLHIVECNFAEGSIYFKQKNYKKAIPIFKECSELPLTNYRTNSWKYLSLEFLSKIYGELKEHDKAYELHKEFSRYKDSAYSTARRQEIIRSQVEHENTLKENEKQALIKENEIKSIKIRKNNIINWLTTFILIQALLFAIIIYRKYRVIKMTSEELRNKQLLIFEQEKEIERRKRAKIIQSLEYKKRELTVKVFQIFQGNQLTQKLLQKLQSLRYKIKTKGQLGEEIRGDIQEMINEIKFNSNVQIWEEFEVYFNKVTPGFKKWLYEKCPSLTHNEIRLCIFSQLNLKIKEISNITLQSTKSINGARTRLRKKLGIEDPNISISSFLQTEFMKDRNYKLEEADV